MQNKNDKVASAAWPTLPHHRLIAFTVAKELLIAVRDAEIADGSLRDQAMRAAQSACLNVAEGASRVSPKERARCFVIARGEGSEAAAAVEIAAITGLASEANALRAARIADRLVGLLTGLIR
jgi:four helix bundle protein